MFFLQDCTGIIDFREYLLGVLIISKASNVAETVELAFKVKYHSGHFPPPPIFFNYENSGSVCYKIHEEKNTLFNFCGITNLH